MSRITDIRVKLGGESLELTSIARSPRGTKTRVATITVTGAKGDREKLRTFLEESIRTLVPNLPTDS